MTCLILTMMEIWIELKQRQNLHTWMKLVTNKSEDKFLSKDEEDLFADEMDELEIAGLDIMELAMMDSDERKEAIEDAGLNPDDYDFD